MLLLNYKWPSDFSKISLSIEDTLGIELSNHEICQGYIDRHLALNKTRVAYGGYLEKRSLYTSNVLFDKGNVRNIHLGVDFWAPAGTAVVCPMNGVLHSFANNSDYGNYGGTIILSHQIGLERCHTLYGHLSVASLKNLTIGMSINQGEILGHLGTPAENVGYAPHLHFQVINDIDAYYGDYPGVCNSADLGYFLQNCPNPIGYLKEFCRLSS